MMVYNITWSATHSLDKENSMMMMESQLWGTTGYLWFKKNFLVMSMCHVNDYMCISFYKTTKKGMLYTLSAILYK